MMNVLLAMIAATSLANLILLGVLFMQDRARRDQRAADERASAAMAAAAEKEREAERREAETSARFDEGISNIMSYAVMGKTGFEQ